MDIGILFKIIAFTIIMITFTALLFYIFIVIIGGGLV
jgi:hypothetical protein